MAADLLHQTTLERPWLNRAARLLSRQIVGLVQEDWTNKRLVVRLCDIAPPKNWMGYPVHWERPHA